MSIDWIPSSKFDWEPARKITPKEIGNRGIIPTDKSPIGIVEYESCIERDFFLLAIHCPSIKQILHQPITIDYIDFRGNTRKYTPDAYLVSDNGSKYLIEIKTEDEFLNQRVKYEERWKHAKKYAEGMGINFKILTEKQIRTPRWFNVWFTLGSSKCHSNDEYIQQLDQFIPMEGIDYKSLCFRVSNALSLPIAKAAQILCFAIYHGLVSVEAFSTKQMRNTTIIQRSAEKKKLPFKPIMDDLADTEDLSNLNLATIEKSPITNSLNRISSDLACPDADDELLNKREEMVLAWLKQPSSMRSAEWRKEFCHKWGMSKSQIYRYIERYQKGGRTELLPKYDNAGRKAKFDPTIIELMENARKLYFKPNFTLKRAYDSLIAACNEKKVIIPTFAKFRYYIYDTSSKLDFATKKGRKYVKTYFTPSLKSFQGAIQPLQIIQVDNSSCDVFITDEENRESISTPNITASIDCYTGMITGFSVSLFPSSSRSILEVLVQTILPKDTISRTYETQNEWNIQGFPVVMLVDNGMDYRAEILKDFCKSYDIIIEFVPIRTPRYKAYIEQWFNLLKNAMKQEGIPGLRPTIRSRLEDTDLKPEKDATLTLLQIETWIHKWIIDEFHFSNHYEGHVIAPQIKLQHAMEGKTDLIFPSPREPPNHRSELDKLTLAILQPKNGCKLSRNGVQWEYLRYNSKEISEIHRISGDVDVDILRDKRDVRHVWVINPGSRIPIEVGLGSGWATALIETFGDVPIHESLWKKSILDVRVQCDGEITPHKYKTLISKQQRINLVEVSKKEKKSVRKEIEKSKETARKDVLGRVAQRRAKQADNNLQSFPDAENPDENDIYTEYTPDVSHHDKPTKDDDDIYKTYKPKLLSTSKYPKKKMLGE